MVIASKQAADKLRDDLMQRFFTIGLGFRLTMDKDDHDNMTFSIRLDKKNPSDQVVESYGIRLFVDPTIEKLGDCEFDYQDGPGAAFVLKQSGPFGVHMKVPASSK